MTAIDGFTGLAYRQLIVWFKRSISAGLTFFVLLAAAPATAEQAESDVRLRVAVVLDASMSMNEHDPGQLALVAARLLVDLTTAGDEITLIVFGTKSRQLGRERMRDDAARGRLYKALAAAERDEWCTDYRVGLQKALDVLDAQARPGERRLVIFLTDGLFDPDRSNESYYSTTEGRALLEKARRQKAFPERPCARSYKRLVPHVEPGFLQQMDTLTEGLARSGVRLYTVGLGSDLASSSAEAARSRAMLERLAGATGGAFLAATEGEQLPVFFASIYSALAGAPVDAPHEVAAEVDHIGFEVLRGAKRVAVVVDAGGDRDLGLRVTGPNNSIPRIHTRPFNVDTNDADGYRLLELDSPTPGHYEIHRDRGALRLRIQEIQEVGLRLALEGLPEVAPQETAPQLTVALRTSAGDPVRLAPDYLSHIDVAYSHGPEKGERRQQQLRLDRSGEAKVAMPALAPGTYRAEASASHDQGLLQVAPVEAKVRIVHQIRIAFAENRLEFDVMAETDDDDLPGGVKLQLTPESSLPIDQEFTVDWTSLTNAGDLEVGPDRFVLGPSKTSVPVKLALREPRKLRDKAAQYEAKVVVRPVQPELFQGDPEWTALVVDGRLRPWDWRRYFQEYQAYVYAGLGCLLLLLLIVGLLWKSRWPKKAKLYYVDLDDPDDEPGRVRLAKKSRSHLPYRSDRHHCGRGGKPGKRSKRRYCTVIATGPRSFEVVPCDADVTHKHDGEEVSTRKPFKGRWEEKYRLGERYEIWLTRS